jgi:hypothetical protein
MWKKCTRAARAWPTMNKKQPAGSGAPRRGTATSRAEEKKAPGTIF